MPVYIVLLSTKHPANIICVFFVTCASFWWIFSQVVCWEIDRKKSRKVHEWKTMLILITKKMYEKVNIIFGKNPQIIC